MRFSSWKRSGLDRGRFSLRKTALGSLLLAAPLLGALVVGGASPLPVSADGGQVAEPSIPEDEESLNGTGLNVTITSSASTDISQSFTMTMASAAEVGHNNGARQNNVFVVIDDDSYDPEAESSTAEGEDLPVYTAAVRWIDFGTNQKTINIPRIVTYKGHFTLTIHAIQSTACYREDIVKGNSFAEGDESDYGYGNTKATKIFIPSSITAVEAGAFNYLPDDISFDFEADTIPSEFEEGWTDCPESRMSFGVEAKAKDVEVSASSHPTFGKSAGYIIGYYEPNENYAPLLVSYDLYKKADKLLVEHKVHALELMSSINPYDAIGGNVGSKTVTLNVDLEMGKDEAIDPESIVFHNIYAPIQVPAGSGITFIPDLSQPFSLKAKVGHTVKHLDISAFVAVAPKRVSTFMGHIEVDIDITPDAHYFQNVNPTVYEQYKSDIEKGTYSTRILLVNLRIAQYEVVFHGEGEELITVKGKVGTPIDYVLLQNGKANTVGFTLSMDWVDGLNKNGGPKFSYDNLVAVNLLGFTIKTDLWINSSNNSLNKSDTYYRFAALNLLPEGKAGSPYTNLTASLLIGFAIYLGAAILVAIAYYAYGKRRYRNDEFRRINDKKYWIAATKNILGFALVFLAIAFIVMRFGIMITTVVAYNPLDAFVIVFALAGAIFIGFAIKGAVTAVRNSMKRKNDAKLHLDKDKAEDGTR